MTRRTSQLIAWGAILGACAASIALNMAQAAEQPRLDYNAGASPGPIPGEVVTTLTWETTPLATQCVASGDWTGEKAAAGNVTLDPVKPPKSYTLGCSWPGDDTAVLSWTPPTENTNGTTLTNLAGYRIVYGTSPTALTQIVELREPGTSRYTIEDLTAGTWHFAVRVFSSTGAESVNSNTTSKTISPPFEVTQTIGVTTPKEPTNLTVE